MKHGLTAKVLALPHEDPEVIQAKRDEWHETYQPEGLVETLLADQAANAAVSLGRCVEAVRATIGYQVRHAEDDWDKAQHLRFKKALAAVEDDALGATLELRSFPAGARWLLDHWNDLAAAETVDVSAVARFRVTKGPGLSPAEVIAAERAALAAKIPELDAAEALDRAEAPVRARGPADTGSVRMLLRYMRSAETTLERSRKELERLQIERFELAEIADELDAENEAGYKVLARPRYDPALYCSKDEWAFKTTPRQLRRKAEMQLRMDDIELRADADRRHPGAWDA